MALTIIILPLFNISVILYESPTIIYPHIFFVHLFSAPLMHSKEEKQGLLYFHVCGLEDVGAALVFLVMSNG